VYLLYSVATLIALVALAPYFLYQALRHNKYVGSLGQRLGYLPVSFNLDAEESIWVHACRSARCSPRGRSSPG
jgi:3-deoxy-D-manno-octulosonic-acid transferase